MNTVLEVYQIYLLLNTNGFQTFIIIGLVVTSMMISRISHHLYTNFQIIFTILFKYMYLNNNVLIRGQLFFQCPLSDLNWLRNTQKF